MSNPTSPLPMSDTGPQNEEEERDESTWPESAGRNQGKDCNKAIMAQMFLHGVADDANRMNHASQLLPPSEASEIRFQTKDSMMRGCAIVA